MRTGVRPPAAPVGSTEPVAVRHELWDTIVEYIVKVFSKSGNVEIGEGRCKST